jgi:hypothetical protein
MSDGSLSDQRLTQWQHPVASVEALDLLYWAMRAVSYWCTAMTIKMASKYGAFYVVFFLIETMVAAGAIRSKYLPNGGVRWLLVKP